MPKKKELPVEMPHTNQTHGLKVTLILTGVLLVLLLLFGLFVADKENKEKKNTSTLTPTITQVSEKPYSAVFLANGQIYFGKISEETDHFLKLEDIYYFRVNNSLPQDTSSKDQSDLKLVKLGVELHQPEDRMKIYLNQVLFVEDLKKDSQVVKAIENYKDSNNQ